MTHRTIHNPYLRYGIDTVWRCGGVTQLRTSIAPYSGEVVSSLIVRRMGKSRVASPSLSIGHTN